MDWVALLVVSCAAWWLLSLSFHLGSTVAACIQPTVRRKSATRHDQPPVSVIVPVKEMAPELEAAFLSIFSQSYPQFEVLVSAVEKSSPALDLARKVAARFPKVKARFICNDPRVAFNPKINNLASPLAAADHDLIFIKDSNIQLDPDQLSRFVSYFTKNVGLVVAAPIGVQPETFPAHIECAIMNGYVARFLLAASAIGWGFGIGAVMLFDRREFNKVGGIAGIAETIGEDHALSKALGRIGLKTVIAASTVRQVVGQRNFSDIWARHLRWLVCRRIEEPIAYYAEPFIGGLFTTGVGAIGASFFGLHAWLSATITILLWVAAEIFLIAFKGWGLSWQSPFAIICSELMLPILWLQARITRKISWSGELREIRRSA